MRLEVHLVVKPRLDCQSARKKRERFGIFLEGGKKSWPHSDRNNVCPFSLLLADVRDELLTGKKSTHRSKFRKIITDREFETAQKFDS